MDGSTTEPLLPFTEANSERSFLTALDEISASSSTPSSRRGEPRGQRRASLFHSTLGGYIWEKPEADDEFQIEGQNVDLDFIDLKPYPDGDYGVVGEQVPITEKVKTIGSHLETNHVFKLELVGNRAIKTAIYSINAVFLLSIAIEIMFVFGVVRTSTPVPIIPTNSSSPIPVKYNNGTLWNAAQTKLVANTIVVSDGLNVSDWVGNRAPPDSPPFSSFATSDFIAAFMSHPSILEYDTNPQLHDAWNETTAVAWFGVSNPPSTSLYRFPIESLDMIFTNHASDWPSNITSEKLSVSFESYGCQEGFGCSSIGGFRLENKGSTFPTVSAKENEYKVRAYYNAHDDTVGTVLASGLRLVIRGDPSGSITACLAGDDCTMSLSMSIRPTYSKLIFIFVLTVFLVYFLFLVWWVYKLFNVVGGFAVWPSETKWLLYSGISLVVSFISVILDTHATVHTFVGYDKFKSASGIIMGLGICIFAFVLMCFANAPRRHVSTRWSFYRLKIFGCATTFSFFVVQNVCMYPSVLGWDEHGTDKEIGGIGFASDQSNWSRNVQVIFCSTAVAICFCFVSFIIYYFLSLRKSCTVLALLPYNATRSLQLPFYFFIWSSTLGIVIVLLCLISDVMVALSKTNERFKNDHTDTLDEITIFIGSMSFYDGGSFYGVVILTFSSVFIIVFQYLFLPPSSKDLRAERKTYYNTEEESRSDQYQGSPTYNLVLERARLLLVCSSEAYLPFTDDERSLQVDAAASARFGINSQDNVAEDVKATSLESRSNSAVPSRFSPSLLFTVNSERLAGARHRRGSYAWGCRVVARITEPAEANIHDTHAIIFRHTQTGNLIVAFQGTATTLQLRTDLMLKKAEVKLDDMLTVTPWINRKKRRTAGYTHPNDIEAQLPNMRNVALMDLLYREGEELPDYLSNVERSGIEVLQGTGKVHFGIWSCYNRVRRQMHIKIREELRAQPGRLFFTGHSLGGALSCLCAYDMCRWVLPSVRKELSQTFGKPTPSIQVSCYAFGSPMIGDMAFVKAYNTVVPDTHIIISDGDLITCTLPCLGYHHLGRENIFDRTGEIRISPLWVEKRFTLQRRASPSAHRVVSYATALGKTENCSMSDEELLNLLRTAYGIPI